MVTRLLLVLFSFVITPALAAANDPLAVSPGRRVALVIGNQSYEHIDEQLDNPANDARAIAAKFRQLNIEVIEAIDLDYRGMRAALLKFDRALKGADAGIFYFAGHGIEYQGRNYIFPTDAVLESEGDVELGLIDMQQVLHVMETSVPTRLIFLDACRNNPLARSFQSSLGASRSASVGRGLGRMDAAIGTFIAYATAPGEIAADGKGENSPFTWSMLQHLNEPNLEISQLMHRVRNSVIEMTDARQVPWESSSLRGPIILNLDVTINPPPVAAPSGAGEDSQRTETVFWESIKDSGRLSSFQAYLERFGSDGVFAPLAEARIRGLKETEAAVLERSLGFDRRQIQQALNMLGYDVGLADGIFGERTRSAIKDWQLSNADEQIGYLTEQQVAAILSTPTSGLSSTAEPPSGLNKETPVSPTATALKTQSRDTQVNAIVLYQEECNDGFEESCTNLGYAYAKGLGVEKDDVKAATFYRLGCDGGNARGCGSLGYAYAKGLGVEQDDATSTAFYQQGCDGGYPRGCGRLGFAYYKGIGVEKDQIKAVAYTEQSCKAGYATGCGHLGWHYEKGLGVRQDYEKASTFYDHACAQDHGRSCSRLGRLYEAGVSVEQDDVKAAALYQKACDLDVARGCLSLEAQKKR